MEIKRPTTIEEQIKILGGRKLVIEDVEFAQNVLFIGKFIIILLVIYIHIKMQMTITKTFLLIKRIEYIYAIDVLGLLYYTR